MTDSIRASIEAASAYLTEHPDEAGYTDSLATATVVDGLRVRVSGPSGEILETDMPAAGRRDGIGGESRMVVPRHSCGVRGVAGDDAGGPDRPRGLSVRGGRGLGVGRSRHPRPRRIDARRPAVDPDRSAPWLRVTRHRATSRNWGRGRSSIVRVGGDGPRGAGDADGRPRGLRSSSATPGRTTPTRSPALPVPAGRTPTGHLRSRIHRGLPGGGLRRPPRRSGGRSTGATGADAQVVAYPTSASADGGSRRPTRGRGRLASSIAASMSVGSAYGLTRNVRGREFYDGEGFVIVGEGSTPDCTSSRIATRPSCRDRGRVRQLEDTDADAAARGYATRGAAHGPRVARPRISRRRETLRGLVRHEELHGFSLWAVDERAGEPRDGASPGSRATVPTSRPPTSCDATDEASDDAARPCERPGGRVRSARAAVDLPCLPPRRSRRVMERTGMAARHSRDDPEPRATP